MTKTTLLFDCAFHSIDLLSDDIFRNSVFVRRRFYGSSIAILQPFQVVRTLRSVVSNGLMPVADSLASVGQTCEFEYAAQERDVTAGLLYPSINS